MEYLTLGNIIDTFSLDGTVKIYSTTDNGDLRYKSGNKVFVCFNNEERIEYTVKSYRHNGLFDFVSFEEILTAKDAENLIGATIEVIKNVKDLKEGYYFYSDLRDCKVLDESKNELGVVKEVEEYPAQITLRVKRNKQPDFLVPFIKEFIIEVNIEAKYIVIRVIKGLL